jgi:drug/metabolite transporter (DMT)-like permease
MTDVRGLLLALATLVLWSISPFFFTNTGKRIGPFPTNLLRLSLALGLLMGLLAIRAALGASAAAPHLAAWLWLTASGALGLAIGDAFLYEGFVTLGPERTSQIQTMAPAVTAVIAWIFLKEFLTWSQTAGMALILAGVFIATTSAARRKTAVLVAEAHAEGAALPMEAPSVKAKAASIASASTSVKPGSLLWTGTMAAAWSALFQGLGTVLARQAFLGQPDLDPLGATTIRIGAGAAALWCYAGFKGPMRPALGAWTDPKVFRLLLAGTVFGPVSGMICYISALKYAPAGIVTTVTFMAPLLIIPIGARLYGTRITAAAMWGTALSVAGVALLGLG